MKKWVFIRIKGRKSRRKGQGMVEYAVIIGFIAIILAALLRLIPEPITAIFHKVADALTPP